MAGYPDTSGENLPPWYHQSSQGERTFLTSIRRSEKDDVFIMEIKAGPILVPTLFPTKKIALPNDPRTWGMSNNKVIAEVEGSLQTVVTMSEPYFIYGSVWQTPDGSIAFGVQNKATEAVCQPPRIILLGTQEPQVNAKLL